MILITDVCYDEQNNSAHIGGITFSDWTSDDVIDKFEIDKTGIDAEYIPGEFYKREMPCLIKLWNSIPEDVKKNISTVIVDGFYDIWDCRPGMGHHFKDWLSENGYSNIEVVGIAKTKCRETNKFTLPVYRTKESKESKWRGAIWVNGSNKNEDYVKRVMSMAGKFRIPSIVKKVDHVSRQLNY